MSRLDLDQIDHDAAAERLRDRDHHREPGARRPRRDDRELAPRRLQQAAMADMASRANPAPTVELPCPVCLAAVYAPPESQLRVDCLECGAALVTRGVGDLAGGDLELKLVEDDADTAVVADPDAPPPALGAGAHLAAFDAGVDGPEPAELDLFPLGGWQRAAFAAINEGMRKTGNKPTRKP